MYTGNTVQASRSYLCVATIAVLSLNAGPATSDRNVTTEHKKGILNPISVAKVSMGFRRGLGVHTQSSAPLRAKYRLLQTEQFHAPKLKRSMAFSTMNLTATSDSKSFALLDIHAVWRASWLMRSHSQKYRTMSTFLKNPQYQVLHSHLRTVCHQDQTHIYECTFELPSIAALGY